MGDSIVTQTSGVGHIINAAENANVSIGDLNITRAC